MAAPPPLPPPHGMAMPSAYAPPPPPPPPPPPQQQPLGMALDPATAMPTTDTIQAVRNKTFSFVFKCWNRLTILRFSLKKNRKTHPLSFPPSAHHRHSLQFLEDNDRLIGAVSQAYGSGRLDAAAAYQARLHANLTYLAAVADASTPSSAEAAGAAATGAGGNPPPQAQAPPPHPQQQQRYAPVPPQQQMHQQQQGQQLYQPPPPPRQY